MARTTRSVALHCILLALLHLLQRPQLARSLASEAVTQVPDREFPTQTVKKLHFPHVKVGPYNWQYFRVEVPHGFQKLRIEFSKLWLIVMTCWPVIVTRIRLFCECAACSASLMGTPHQILISPRLCVSEKNKKQGLLNPLTCFRLAAPPSPAAPMPSVEQAALAAGQPENASKIGKCASFTNTTTVNLDNEQVTAGEWHIGVFSNSQPTRFQSKMLFCNSLPTLSFFLQACQISRGPVYTFSLRLSVFGCGSAAFTGKHCNLTITQLCFGNQEFDRVNTHASGAPLATPHFSHKSESPKTGTPSLSPDHGNWNILRNQKFDATHWKYYSLRIGDFATSLEIQVEHSISNGVLARSLNLFARFGALPTKTNISVDYLHVAVPPRGWWYIEVCNAAESSDGQSFSLLWKLQSWAADEPKWKLFQLERVLQEVAFESPFDSFFSLPDKSSESSPSEWFPIKFPASLKSDPKSEYWLYFTLQIPQGVAGATLTLEIRNVPTSGADLYIRHEGLPTVERHDLHLKSRDGVPKPEFNNYSAKSQTEREGSELQFAGNAVALNMMFPLEGAWCIGVRTMNGELVSLKHEVSQNNAVEQVKSLPILTLESASYVERFIKWFKVKAAWRGFANELTQSNTSSLYGEVSVEGGNITTPVTNSVQSQGLDSVGIVAYQGSGHEFERNIADEGLELVDIVLSKESLPVSNVGSKNIELDKYAGNDFPQMRVAIHGCLNYCSGHGRCQTTYDSSRLYQYSYCHCDNTHGGDDCSVVLVPANEEVLHIWALVGSNFAAIMPSLWAIRHNAYAEWVTYTFSGLASGVYHSCDAGGWCALSYDTLQFLDFWLSFLAVVVTCLHIASLEDTTKDMALMGSAIVTAAVTKENATSAWNVLLVVLMSLVGLILGWALECWYFHLLPSWIHALAPLENPFSTLAGLYHDLEEFKRQMQKRFHWIHLFTGLGILLMARLTWILEKDDTYWIWHSLWHVSIYTSAFVILNSSCERETWASHPSSDDEWLRRNDEDECQSTGLHEFEIGSESSIEQAVSDHHQRKHEQGGGIT